MLNLSDTTPDLDCSFGYRFAQEFRTRPDQAGKRAVEVMKAVGAAWRSLTQEEKDVSRLFSSCFSLPVINIAETLSSNINLSPPSQLLSRKTLEHSEPSSSSIRFYLNPMSTHFV